MIRMATSELAHSSIATKIPIKESQNNFITKHWQELKLGLAGFLREWRENSINFETRKIEFMRVELTEEGSPRFVSREDYEKYLRKEIEMSQKRTANWSRRH